MERLRGSNSPCLRTFRISKIRNYLIFEWNEADFQITALI